MKNIIFILLFLTFLTSCSSFKEAGKVLRNEKVRTTDEFLVKQKDPLELPPNYEQIPEPNSKKINKKNDDRKIKNILNAPEEEKISKTKSTSVENSVLNKIRK
jgi:hypothetical protein